MSRIIRARKKPVEIQAIRLDGTKECADEAVMWFTGSRQDVWTKDYHLDTNTPDEIQVGLTIRCIDGNLADIEPGNYLMRGVKGEFYPCRRDIFEATHEVLFANQAEGGKP